MLRTDTHRRAIWMGAALLLGACEQPAATRPAPVLAPERDVRAAASALPISPSVELEAARLALTHSADPRARSVSATASARSTTRSNAVSAAAALRPLLPATTADQLPTHARALTASALRW